MYLTLSQFCIHLYGTAIFFFRIFLFKEIKFAKRNKILSFKKSNQIENSDFSHSLFFNESMYRR